MTSLITCCMDCPRRQLGCHAKCKEYLAQKAAIPPRTVDVARAYLIKRRARIVQFLRTHSRP